MEKGKLVFDLNAIIDFVTQKDDYNGDSHQEITEFYAADEDDGSLSLVNRQLNEIKGMKNDTTTSLRYDLVKSLMIAIGSIQDMSIIGAGETICLNTLISQGFIKEVNS